MAAQTYARIIVNQTAGSGTTKRKWLSIRKALTQAGLSFDYVYTESNGHAFELAKEAAQAGYELVVATGGDGTINEVVNGLVASGNAKGTTMGILNTGTGCDLARFLNIPRNCQKACQRLADPYKTSIDVGLVEYQDNDKRASRYFISAAGLGFDGEVVETVHKQPRLLQGTVPYIFGVLHSLNNYQNKDIRLQIGEKSEDVRICSVVIANGGFYGKGMHVAPEASINDGLFEVIIIGDVGKLDLLRSFPKIYRGTHITHPKVRMERADQVTIQSSEQVLIQADGELIGEGPATFKVLPSALNVAV